MTGKCPASPAFLGGIKGHDQNEISLPRSDALWAGSFISGEMGNKWKEVSDHLFIGLGFFLHLREK